MKQESRLHQWLTNRIGPVATISIAQLFGTSLWFSANSAADDLVNAWHVTITDIGWLTSAVQGGFIIGTLGISLSGRADAYRASSIFVFSAVLGAIFNASFALFSHDLVSAVIYRFFVGLCLAGVYPIGMKLVVSWAPERTGMALAQLVAMLTLGTALPHALRQVGTDLPWQTVIMASSLLALGGACLSYLLGDGPHLHNPPQTDDPKIRGAVRPAQVFAAFRLAAFRAAMLGYLGHMWELYTFWTAVPLFVASAELPAYIDLTGRSGISFLIIGVGAFGCIIGGVMSRRIGSAKVAMGALAISGACCILFAIGWRVLPAPILAVVLLVWGAAVIADSPQFSALAARACPPELVGSALAIMNSLGFAITVVSISGTMALFAHIGADAAWLMMPGPLLGLLGFLPLLRQGGKNKESHEQRQR